MKKLIKIICVLLMTLSAAIASDDYACFKVDKKIINCDERTLLAAFHHIKSFQKNKKKGIIKESLNIGGKVLVATGAAWYTLGFIPANAIKASPLLTALNNRIGLFGFNALLGGPMVAVVGGVIWMLTPNETVDDSMAGYLSSDRGIAELLQLTDIELIDFAKEDPQISLRVIQIYHAISMNDQEPK